MFDSMEQRWVFEEKLMDGLQGRMNLLQPQREREDIIGQIMNQLLESETESLRDHLGDSLHRKKFIREFLSYGIVTDLLRDIHVEDITINSLLPIYMHHSQKGYVSSGKKFGHRRELDIFIRKLLLFSGRGPEIHKIMNLELPHLDGRVNIALSPFGPQITMAKSKVAPLSVIDLIRLGSLNAEVAALIWLYMEGLRIRPANIMITGGPGVGKTTFLNAIMSFSPSSDRLVVIEDTLELNTFLDESASRLESTADVTLADLVKNSLRMRPERIIIGEVRGVEARDMITACNIGKYCMGTIHALTSREAIIRLQNEPMNIPEMLVNLIDVFIVLKRYHVQNRLFRVVDEVSETSGMEQVKILLANVYKYDYEKHQIRTMSPSTVYRDRLAQEAGWTPKQVIKEHYLRAFLLDQLDKRDMTTVKEVTIFCRAYSDDPDGIVAKLGYDRRQLLKD